MSQHPANHKPRHCSGILFYSFFPIFYDFSLKINRFGAPEEKYYMEIAPEWLRSVFWFIGNQSGTVSGRKVHIWNIIHNINSKNTKNQCLIFKSQHLVINPGQGPLLKCAPGQDSIKDSSIIKSYWLKSGVMDKQNLISWFGAKSGWGQILNRFAIRWPCPNLRIFWKFSNWFAKKNLDSVQKRI